jgi:pyridoxamine 5'-phosphate oxidase
MIPTMNDENPFALFGDWFQRATRTGIDKPHAMTLATVAADGRPSARMVLLSSFDERGFVFHTNYESKKGLDIETNSHVALIFWWDSLGRQVRIEGAASRTTPAEADAYFAKRPRGSQLSAWASAQSRPIASRAELEEQMRTLEGKYRDHAVPRPPHWGGYRVVPDAFEFWEHRENRLHERRRFERDQNGAWPRRHLAP